MRTVAEQMGLSDCVKVEQQSDTQLEACRAVIVPSLSEGISWSVLEAIAAGKPVLCSDVATSHELAGDAALYVDPRRPTTIAEAIEVSATAPQRMAELKAAAQRRRSELVANAATMVEQYLAVFRGAVVRS